MRREGPRQQGSGPSAQDQRVWHEKLLHPKALEALKCRFLSLSRTLQLDPSPHSFFSIPPELPS